MNRQVTFRFYSLVLASVGLGLATLATGRPALAALAAVLGAVPALGLIGWRWPNVQVDLRTSTARVVEGDELRIVVELSADGEVPWVDVEIEPGSGLRSTDGFLRRVIHIPVGMARVVSFPVRPTEWGVLEIGRYRIVARDRFGLFSLSTVGSIPGTLRVYPSDARLRSIAAPARTVGTLGVHLAPERGDGCEYADVRAWQPGDRTRNINWRVSARRGAMWVTERHPERAADVIVVLDDTAALGPADDSTLRRAVQAAMALTEGHLAAQDRVGLAALGAPLRWMRPRAGNRQLYAIVDTLLDCRTARMIGVGRSGPGSVLLGGLRPGTTVVALTVLADDRVVEILAELRRHGHHVVALIVEPEQTATDDSAPSTLSEVLARRLWDVERVARRERLNDAGVLSLSWDGHTPLGALLGSALAHRAVPAR